jgi:hypothetical protein
VAEIEPVRQGEEAGRVADARVFYFAFPGSS